jgi:hypothetical protein
MNRRPLGAVLGDELEALEARGLLRRPDGPTNEGLIDLSSNDYLGYGREPWPVPVDAVRSGAMASRLVFGDTSAHRSAESALARWVGAESALLFSSGYAANVGALSALAIHEGFGDYWAVTVTDVIAPTPDPACVADWDSVSYTSKVPHCLRRVDMDLHYPEDLSGEPHHDGQIWSRALWDIRIQLGHVKADTLILEAQFSFAPDTSMPDAAAATVDAAMELYGPSSANAVRSAFEARGILP